MPFDMSTVGDILVCPACHSALVLEQDTLVDSSPDCRRAYQILDGIPRLLVSESQELEQDSWSDIMLRHGRDVHTGEPTETTTEPADSTEEPA